MLLKIIVSNDEISATAFICKVQICYLVQKGFKMEGKGEKKVERTDSWPLVEQIGWDPCHSCR